MTETKRKVLIVDDSALVRQALRALLDQHPGLHVVGDAQDPYEAREKIISLQPDVLTLDVAMPRMDGLTFLAKLMKAHPMPVVLISALTQKGSTVALEALALGAVEVIQKTAISPSRDAQDLAIDIAETVYAASWARVQPPRQERTPKAQRPHHPSWSPESNLARHLIAIGASTGGTEAIQDILEALPEDLPPILIVQHMLPGLISSFAARLDRTCGPRVKEAKDGERTEPGWAYMAPAGFHLGVEEAGLGYRLQLLPGPPVNRHRPSVDVLFRAVAQTACHRALGILLTGMGSDGADGLLQMRQAGAMTLGQDEASCVVYGMPRIAWERKAVQSQVSLESMAGRILNWAHHVGKGE